MSQWTPLKTSIDLSQYEVRTTLKQSPNMNWLESMKTLIEYQEFLRNFQYVKGTEKQDGKYDHFTSTSKNLKHFFLIFSFTKRSTIVETA